ncbi:TonB-dependent receptor [Persicobacter diffluens]|uniref:TonB-dependent receptor n=1 Tax=Persicobacter diffluens TaxID=981 RepID=A0AAN5AK17_9BACT|nr:TonB-dependent receptor [Persicobacter diffluens]
MKNILLTFWLTAFASVAAFAQSGTIKGAVKDKTTGEEIIGANVLITGTTSGAATDVFGNFEFKAAAGERSITVSYIGYKDWTGTVTVAAGSTSALNVNLDPDLVELEGVVIKSKAERSGSEVLLLEQKKAATMVENIGVKEMAVKGVSNVEDGLTKMSGIAKVGSKGVYVRGLGDRYNSATLNGLPVPATNPDMKMIPLSIFPTDVVEAISVSKTFNASQYGDFGGATIDIGTKTYPEEAFLSVGVGASGNSIVTGKDFKTFQDGQFERLGFSGNGRENTVNQRNVPSSRETGGDPFKTGFTPTTIQAPVGFDFNIRGGNKFDVGSEGQIGFIASVAHENDFEYRGGSRRNLNAQAVELNNFQRDEYNYATLTTALLGVNYQLNPRHDFTYNLLFANTSDNTTSELFGYVQDVAANDILIRRNTYVQSRLLTNQLLGEHLLNDNETLTLDWGVSYSTTNRVEPDRRQNSFRVDSQKLLQLNASQNHRFWSDMDEHEIAAKTGLLWKHGAMADDEAKGTVAFGYQGKFKGRQMQNYQYNIRASGDGLNQNVDPENPNEFFSDENYLKGNYTYSNGIDVAQHEFEADMNVHGLYGSYDYNINERLKALIGVRFENGLQEVRFRNLRNSYDDPYQISQYKTNDILPSLSLKYAVNDKSNLRFAFSKTLTRPGMREIIPFQYQDVDGNLFEGNRDLQNSTNYNLDLKWEIFPNAGELFSVSLFGKKIYDAIELTQVAQGGGNLFTYTNTEGANIGGAEVEFNKNLENVLGDAFQGISIGLNATYMYSEIVLKEGDPKSEILTNKSRQLQGASPYLVNANLAYNKEFGAWSTTFSGVFNMFGDRVFSAGQQGAGDIYEKAVPKLDFVWKNTFSDKWSVDLKVKNILNPEIERYQKEFSDTAIQDQTVDSFYEGVSFSVGVSYLIK